MKYGRALSIVAAVLASGCDSGERPRSPITPKNLTGVALSQTSVMLARNEKLQLQAVAQYSDGSTEIVTSSGTWTTGNADVVSVSSGSIIGSGPGRAEIHVVVGGMRASSEVLVRRNLAMSAAVTVSAVNANVAELRAYVDGRLVEFLGSHSDHFAPQTKTIAFSGVDVTPGEHAMTVDVRRLGFHSLDTHGATLAATFTAAPAPVVQFTDADTGESLDPIVLPTQQVSAETHGATIAWHLSIPALTQ